MSDADHLTDTNWHQICTPWSHSRHKVFLYIDGVSEKATSRHTNPFRADDDVANTFRITELNLCNRELSDEEITQNAQQCDELKGTAKAWHEFHDKAKEQEAKFTAHHLNVRLLLRYPGLLLKVRNFRIKLGVVPRRKAA